MKPQQRKFIVEVKSARRRTATRPSSIWGDMDLKALARDAETEVPHLFEAARTPDELAAASGAEASTNERGEADGTVQVSERVVLEEVAGVAEAATSSAPIASVEDGQLKEKSPRASKRPRSVREKRGTLVETATAPAEAAPDELVALEEENRKLKGLLARRVRQENVQLKKMLERFV